MKTGRTAVVVRAEDGVFQPMLLKPLSGGDSAFVYRLTGCVLRRIGSRGDGQQIMSLSDLYEEVFVFVNVPLETTNHMFLEALIQLTLLDNAGIVTGILINERRRILSAGFDLRLSGEYKDSYAGRLFDSSTFEGVRQVASLSPYFFAVRREALLAVGGLGILSSRRMPQLLQRLLARGQDSGAPCLVTSSAVATLAGNIPQLSGGSAGVLDLCFQ